MASVGSSFLHVSTLQIIIHLLAQRSWDNYIIYALILSVIDLQVFLLYTGVD